MGIDIYLEWPDMTKEENDAQITGFSTISGHVGYLREAYHGEPYATRALVPEAFDEGEAQIPAKVLQERLGGVGELVVQREKEIYSQTNDAEIERVLQSFKDFVALAATKEAEHGQPCTIIASY